MFARRLAGHSLVARTCLLAAIVTPGSACVGTGEGLGSINGSTKTEESIQLPAAEQMIDELDRVMTSYGTIGVKTPDVWGQDRLAKFRSEYETQMGEWLKLGFKGEINASVQRGETESTLIQVGVNRTPKPANTSPSTSTPEDDTTLLRSMDQQRAALDSGLPVSKTTAPYPLAALERSVVLDEHSNYLNHLNQLRRINAGDDLADRPGYGLYLIRIPVTLSPGPRSRRGKGAIITVSANPLITKHTLRNALRDVVINETVNNLTQTLGHQEAEARDQPATPAIAAFSLISLADAELFYGQSSIELLREETEHQLARDLGGEPHHRAARVAEWLRNELQSSYHLLEEAATPVRSTQLASTGDPLEELGDQISRRDFNRIARLQVHGGKDKDAQVKKASTHAGQGDAERSGRRSDVVNLLAFALRIQAAGVNRRLKQDIADQDPSIKREALRSLCFFEPEVSDEALRAFEHYVDAKWPLRVYAIEPVIAQQNVADGSSRRMHTALDLVAAGPAGPARAIAGLTNDRRVSEDEATIRLNPTMVGFGAGQSTFGWVFYPRVQARQGRDGRFLTDIALLLNGRWPDPIGGNQSIEPGQRECTALIEMPNFIPKVEFVTVANWFRTSEVGDGQRSELERASVLGRKLVAAENAFNRARVEGQYRPDEYLIAKQRLEQIRDMMPTQRMIVRVPISGDNNDSRIFCSLGLQLRPSLVGWHGRPPEQGVESTLFVEGRNFSVHDTRVIAGGRPAKAVLVSRHLLEVSIARDASPTPSADGSPLLDINIATPNGVSNHLLIKMAVPDPCRKPPPPEPVPVQAKREKAGAVKVVHGEDGSKPDRPTR